MCNHLLLLRSWHILKPQGNLQVFVPSELCVPTCCAMRARTRVVCVCATNSKTTKDFVLVALFDHLEIMGGHNAYPMSSLID
eukprot:138469-Amphidinium_carterae.1